MQMLLGASTLHNVLHEQPNMVSAGISMQHNARLLCISVSSSRQLDPQSRRLTKLGYQSSLLLTWC